LTGLFESGFVITGLIKIKSVLQCHWIPPLVTICGVPVLTCRTCDLIFGSERSRLMDVDKWW